MRRSLISLLLALPIWAQFEPAPQQQPYPQQAPAGYPPYQTQQQYPPQQYPAQQQDDQNRDWATDQQHGVARLRLAQGDVNLRRGDNGILTAVIMNAPLMSHDHLQTSPGSRAEVELDAGIVVRLAPDTDLGFADLAFGHAQLQLGMGTMIVRVLRNTQSQLEIDTPSVAFHPLGQGDYRISVYENGTSQVTARAGRMEMTGPRGSQTIEPGQSMLVRGDSTDPEFQQTSAPPRDQFDEWSGSRDAEIVTARSPQYIGGEVQGGEDLDRYGNWVPSPDYGQVWAPQGMPADWSPYSNGQWTYLDYYGWSWIGYEPWGWAPYHYGRWFWNTGIGWCWWPGLRAGFGFRWSPAMVSFFGFGGGLGWVALAPFELFHPWWGHGFGGWGAFHGGYDLQHFRNAGIRGGAITAGFNSFGGAGHRFSMASAGQIRSASLYRGSLPVSPNAASYRFADRAVNANPRLSQAGSRSFFSSNYRSAGSYNSGARSTAGSSGGGWQHFGTSTPRTQPQNFAAPRSGANAESGWHGFATPHTNSAPSYGGQGYGAPRNNYPATNYGGGAYRAPSASAPRYNYNAPTAPHYNSAPRYSAPAAPHYSAPRSAPAPHYSAPKNSGGGGHASSGGGHGGGHGGGGHHR